MDVSRTPCRSAGMMEEPVPGRRSPYRPGPPPALVQPHEHPCVRSAVMNPMLQLLVWRPLERPTMLPLTVYAVALSGALEEMPPPQVSVLSTELPTERLLVLSWPLKQLRTPAHAGVPVAGNEAAHAAARGLTRRAAADLVAASAPESGAVATAGEDVTTDEQDITQHHRLNRRKYPPAHDKLNKTEAVTWRLLQTHTYPSPATLRHCYPSLYPTDGCQTSLVREKIRAQSSPSPPPRRGRGRPPPRLRSPPRIASGGGAATGRRRSPATTWPTSFGPSSKPKMPPGYKDFEPSPEAPPPPSSSTEGAAPMMANDAIVVVEPSTLPRSLISFFCRLPWERQPKMPQGLLQGGAAPAFRGRTLSERWSLDAPWSYTEEERASPCHLCGVMLFVQHHHERGEFHTEREDRQDQKQSASTRHLTSADVEAALVIITRWCTEHPLPPTGDADIENHLSLHHSPLRLSYSAPILIYILL
ncbi:hypothetical protein HPB47_006651 [Ixodes persulcatus]|uniref:Uncharacterized protein n=1 Tax=Ixodes persulcatus TaxID=34615 RepID=A0AC60P9J9_IXOPE|nr:hypothetical protein HPB47_006651 [Ixodes persulcatus]